MTYIQFLLTDWPDTSYEAIPEELIPVYKQDLHYQRGGKV